MDQHSSGFGGQAFTGQVDGIAQLKEQWPGICRNVGDALERAPTTGDGATAYQPLIAVVNQLQQTLTSLQQTRAVTQAGSGGGRYSGGT